jgi:hypothetical protein
MLVLVLVLVFVAPFALPRRVRIRGLDSDPETAPAAG